MQAITPLSLSDFTAHVTQPLIKLEVLYDGSWQTPEAIISDAQATLMNMSTSMGGAEPQLYAMAGTWSAKVYNPSAQFHPLHPTSGFTDVFIIGRKVRLSQGIRKVYIVATAHRGVTANVATIGTASAHGLTAGDTVAIFGMADAAYNGLHVVATAPNTTHFTFALTHADEGETVDVGGLVGGGSADHYWTAMYGIISSVDYDLATSCVDISGMDYCQALVDYKLRQWQDLQFPTGAGGVREITLAAGAEMVTNGGFASATTNWTALYCTLASVAGGVSGNCLEITQALGATPQAQQTLTGLVVGRSYVLSGYVKEGTATAEAFGLLVGTTIGGDQVTSIRGYTTGAWVKWSVSFVAPATTLYLSIEKEFSLSATTMLADTVSVRETVAHSYLMDVATYPTHPLATGAFSLVEFLGGFIVSAIYYENEHWTWNSTGPYFVFNEDFPMPAVGTVYWAYAFEAQIAEDVVFYLLANSGLYASYALAKADSIYTVTGITIDRVSFPPGTNAFEAIAQIAERVNYVFYFDHDGKPVFIPKPALKAAGLEDLTLLKDEVAAVKYTKNDREFYNRITIEGEDQAHPTQLGGAESARLKGTASDAASINTCGEKNLPINNVFWQTQATIDASATALLVLLKDPKAYFYFDLKFCPLPVEWGDTVKVTIDLPLVVALSGYDYGVAEYGLAEYGAFTDTSVSVRGLIRDIKVNDFSQSIILELGV